MTLCKQSAAAAAMLMAACAPAGEADNAAQPVPQAQPGPEAQPGESAGPSGADAAGPRDPADAAPDALASLLESSVPADGARLTASPENLVLNFRQPMRLAEVTVAGPGGRMVPMMITAVGLVRTYSVPLPELEPGHWRVQWRALDAAGASREGSFGFTVG